MNDFLLLDINWNLKDHIIELYHVCLRACCQVRIIASFCHSVWPIWKPDILDNPWRALWTKIVLRIVTDEIHQTDSGSVCTRDTIRVDCRRCKCDHMFVEKDFCFLLWKVLDIYGLLEALKKASTLPLAARPTCLTSFFRSHSPSLFFNWYESRSKSRTWEFIWRPLVPPKKMFLPFSIKWEQCPCARLSSFAVSCFVCVFPRFSEVNISTKLPRVYSDMWSNQTNVREAKFRVPQLGGK